MFVNSPGQIFLLFLIFMYVSTLNTSHYSFQNCSDTVQERDQCKQIITWKQVYVSKCIVWQTWHKEKEQTIT